MIDFQLMLNSIPILLQSALVTLALAFCASLIGFVGGTILGIAQTSKFKWLKWLITVFVTTIRGTPMLLQIMFFYIMLPLINIHISAFATALIAIGINSSAYISQIIRAGIKSIPVGQIEAAYTLGIGNFDLTRYIILPQALQVVIPALANEFITLIKDSSLASLIGVIELYQRGNIIISQTHDALTIYTLTGLIYLFMTTLLSIVVYYLETKLNKNVGN